MAPSSLVREKALLEVIRQGFLVSSRSQTHAMLGDRTSYVGMSDVGKYLECPRAAVASRIFPEPENLDRLLPLQRGHWFEQGIGEGLSALGLRVLPQLEIDWIYKDTPIRAHLDFTLVWDSPRKAVRILEVKSTENIPTEPYPSHLIQVKGQTSLLAALWHQSVFSVRNASGEQICHARTFPEICKLQWGLVMPDTPEGIDLEGWLLYLSMKDCRAFGPFVSGKETLEVVGKTAEQFWQETCSCRQQQRELDALRYARGFHLLCATCSFNEGCPKFRQGDFQPQWEPAVTRLEQLKEERSTLDIRIKEIESALKQAHQLASTTDWISTGQHRFRLGMSSGRRTLDRKGLAQELAHIFHEEGLDHIDVDALLQRHEQEGKPVARLSITPIH